MLSNEFDQKAVEKTHYMLHIQKYTYSFYLFSPLSHIHIVRVERFTVLCDE